MGGAEFVAAAEPLAGHPSGLVALFAKRLSDVLAKHGAALTAKLTNIKLQPANTSLDEKELESIHKMTAPIIELARAGAVRGKPIPAPLRAEVLEVIAGYCPSSTASMEAAAELSHLVEASLGGKGEPPVAAQAAAEAIRQALYKCFDHTHSAWINTDDVAALKLAAEQGLMGALAYLQACTAAKPDAEGLAKALGEVHRRTGEGAAPREAENAAGAEEVCKTLIAQLEALKAEAASIAELAAARKEITQLAAQFIAAINKEDRKAAAECLTPAMARAIEKLPSLKAAVGGAGDGQSLEFLYLLRFGAPGGKPFVDVQVILRGKKDEYQQRAARLQLESTPAGWRITTGS